MTDTQSSASITTANVPTSDKTAVGGIPVVSMSAHTSIVKKLQSDLNVANMWIDGLEADIAKSYPKSAVLILSVAAFIFGFLVKWIF